MRVINALIAFSIESRPVGHTGIEEADVYVIKMVGRVYPFAAAVVGLEA